MRIASLLVLMLYLFAAVSCSTDGIAISTASEDTNANQTDRIDINSADAVDLQRIPNIGEKLAVAIVEHRAKYGPFRRTEQLMMIDGISDRRYRRIRHLVFVK